MAVQPPLAEEVAVVGRNGDPAVDVLTQRFDLVEHVVEIRSVGRPYAIDADLILSEGDPWICRVAVAAGPHQSAVTVERIGHKGVVRLHVVDDQAIRGGLAGVCDGAIRDRCWWDRVVCVVPRIFPDRIKGGKRIRIEIPIRPRVGRHQYRSFGFGVADECVFEPLRGGAADRAERADIGEKRVVVGDRRKQIGPTAVEDDQHVPRPLEDVRPVGQPPTDRLDHSQIGRPEPTHSRFYHGLCSAETLKIPSPCVGASRRGNFTSRPRGGSVHCLFVGAGSIASSYAAGLAGSELTLAGVCDLDSDRAETLAASHDCPAFADLDAALDAVDAPLVVNLTSHAAHAEVTRTALAADRHVYSEKPLALDGETAGELLEMARERQLALGCAPAAVTGPTQQRARRLLEEGRLGPVQLAYAHAHVGRVTDWHDRPDSFLAIGPLYDGGVYPLSLLVAWFGPVDRVRVADSLDLWPQREATHPAADSHVEATLAFRAGPTVRLTASFYAPHRSREFYGLELHGDDGSLSLDNTGRMEPASDAVQYGGLGRSYTTVPPQSPTASRAYLDAVDELAASVAASEPNRHTARRGAHVVAVCNAIETAAAEGGPIQVPSHGVTVPDTTQSTVTTASDDHTLSLPPIGFGCSRYRGNEYVDRTASIATALDAGYRLLDSAELYGNEFRIGDQLDAPGSPDRDRLTLLGKVWRTNHTREHLLAACEGSLRELGIDAFDCYMLHWPEAWAHQGSLDRLAEKPVDIQEALTFPTDADGEIETASIPLAEAWANLEEVVERGWAETLGVCNVSRSQLETILDAASIPPAVVQIERHPYRPQRELVEYCHSRDIAVVAHSPLSAPGLLSEPVVADIGDSYGLSPAGVVVAWNATQGVVPIPSSTTDEHIVANAAAVATRLAPADCARIDELRDPTFSR